jgi:hypothetical protein
MPDKWEELLPFYAAGTLEPAQKTALEKHLDDCETCRRSLNEWIVIGDGVRAEAESWARTMPLPRYNGQFGEAPTGRTRVVRKRPRRTMAIATLAASLIAVFLLGGLIAYMATRIRSNDPSARPPDDVTGVAANSTDVSGTQTAISGTLAPQITKTNDLGLITNTPLAPQPTVTFTIVFAPTTTPKPSDVPLVQGTIRPPTIQPTPLYGCMATSTSNQGATIRRTPETSGEIVDNLGGSVLPVFTTVNGWYEVFAPNINLPGWVWGGDIYLQGADCGIVPFPSPTIVSGSVVSCTGFTLNNLQVRPDPFDWSPVTGHIASGSTVEVLAWSDNNWYTVRAADSSTGWTRIETVRLTGDCSTLGVTIGYIQMESQTATALAPMATPTP